MTSHCPVQVAFNTTTVSNWLLCRSVRDVSPITSALNQTFHSGCFLFHHALSAKWKNYGSDK